MVVGLTGGIGSGKSTVAKMFSEFNEVAVYIADIEAKKLMHSSNSIRENIINEFGELAYVNNELNRKYISSIVFNKPERLKKLNSIIHPEVRKHFFKFKENNKNYDYIIYEAAILFEANANVFCDKIITVFAPLESRIKRVVKRDKIAEKEVENRIKNQWKEDKKLLQSNYIIVNDDLTKTILQVQKIHKILTQNCL